MTRLGKKQLAILLEATRRYLAFQDENFLKPLHQAWTGLGTVTTYRSVHKAGLMTIATKPNPGYMTWWKLTSKGAAIVRRWLNDGLKKEHFSNDFTGDYSLAPQYGVSLSVTGIKIVNQSVASSKPKAYGEYLDLGLTRLEKEVLIVSSFTLQNAC